MNVFDEIMYHFESVLSIVCWCSDWISLSSGENVGTSIHYE